MPTDAPPRARRRGVHVREVAVRASSLAGRAARSDGPNRDDSAQLLQSELLVDSLGYAIKRAQIRCYEALYQVLPVDLSPTRMSALSIIGANPGMSQAALGGMLHVAGPSVVKIVDILEDLGLVERQTAKSDRRVYALMLTRRGQAEVERCRELVAAYELRIAEKLSEADRRRLLQLLSRVAT